MSAAAVRPPRQRSSGYSSGAAAAATAPPAPSIALDSRPASPSTQSTAGAFIYELDDVPPTLRKAKKVDQNGQIKRVRTVEEAQKKVWTTIARRDVVKVSMPCNRTLTFR